MTRKTYHRRTDGSLCYHEWTPGPRPCGLVGVHAEIPPEHLAVMKVRNAECGGMLPVNEQIRRAIRAYLVDGLVYTSQVNT